MNSKNNKSMAWKKVAIITFWLCLWQLVAACTHNSILLVTPLQAAKAFLENLTRPDFWKIVAYSFGRVGLGFLLALLAGLIAGALAYGHTFIEDLLAPLMTTVKSIPVVSFVVLLLIWFGSDWLSMFISFLVVLPNVYESTMAGLRSTDPELLEMAEVFHVGKLNRFFYIYRPALMPYMLSCLKVSLGMSWKSGVAAEVIGMPRYSLGERLYMSKIYLDTAGLFSWTLVIILLSFTFEKTVLYLAKRFDAWNVSPICVKQNRINGRTGKTPVKGMVRNIEKSICIENISKSYGEQKVIDGFSYTIKPGEKYCLTAPSGTGKTTLLKLINRIEKPDSGAIEGVPEHMGMVFQEDRLCEKYDAITNIMLTAKSPKNTETLSAKTVSMEKLSRKRASRERVYRKKVYRDKVYKEALQILPEDCLNKPVSELSGGMKRRCAILRAMLSNSDIIIMDEPFNGLDEENRKKTAAYILKNLEGRTLIITSHRIEDIKLLGGIKVEVPVQT